MISARFAQPIASSIQRLVGFLLVASCYLLIAFFNPVNAQTNPYTVPNTNPDVPKNLHTWTQNVMIEVMSAMICQLSGIDPVNSHEKCLGIDPKTKKIGFVDGGGGAIGIISNSISYLFMPPVRLSDYTQYIGRNFGIVKPAYAESIGLQGLSPLRELWIAFRNIVYLIYILIFIIIGMAIMLRIKIDPRTVMSIQNQIPKIIISMLLVTFSFAIGGFLIDLMYVGTYLTYGVIANANVPGVDVSKLDPALTQTSTVFGAVGGLGSIISITNTSALSITNLIGEFLGISQSFKDVSPIQVSFAPFSISLNILPITLTSSGLELRSLLDWLIDLISTGTAFFVGKAASTALVPLPAAPGFVAGIIAGYALAEGALRVGLPYLISFLVVIIALLWALFRLWFTLIKAYIYILIDIVIAPFWIVLGLFPGNETATFETWIRDLLANLSAFPVTLAMFLLGKVFIDSFNTSWNSSVPLFVPPFIGNPQDAGASIGSIIGLGVILMTPQVVEIMKAVFKSPQIKFTAAVGQAMGVGSPQGLIGSASQLGSTYFGLSHLGLAFKGLMGKRGGP